MKKILCFVLALGVIFSCVSVSAEELVTVKINDKVIDFDVPAQIINDRTMVPMRKIFEELGAGVDWIEESQSIIATRDRYFIMMKIDVPKIMVTDVLETDKSKKSKIISLDVAPMILNDRTLVPARAVAETLNAKVEWNEAEQTVYITK